MNRTKLLFAAFFVSAVLFLTACGTAAKQSGENEPKQAGNRHTQAQAGRASTAAATRPVGTTAAPPPSTEGTAPPTTAAKPPPSTTAAGIGLEKAKAIALGHAGVTAAQARFQKVKSERDGGVTKYRVEFEAAGFDYEYEIHAGTGVILEAARKRAPEQPTAAPPSRSTAMGEISVEKAKAIALADAGLTASQVRFRKAEREREDGVVLYEIEFENGGGEYEYNIHAGTGVILKRDIDRD